MNTLAFGAFQNKNGRVAPAMICDISSGPLVINSAFCTPTNPKSIASKTPPARPSRPSTKLNAFEKNSIAKTPRAIESNCLTLPLVSKIIENVAATNCIKIFCFQPSPRVPGISLGTT